MSNIKRPRVSAELIWLSHNFPATFVMIHHKVIEMLLNMPAEHCCIAKQHTDFSLFTQITNNASGWVLGNVSTTVHSMKLHNSQRAMDSIFLCSVLMTMTVYFYFSCKCSCYHLKWKHGSVRTSTWTILMHFFLVPTKKRSGSSWRTRYCMVSTFIMAQNVFNERP